MPRTTSPGKLVYLALVGLVALILVGVLIALDPPGTARYGVIRGAALLGYVAVFLVIVSSAYMRQMKNIFGRPFLKVHHTLSVAGLILITLHPLVVAWDYATASILLPQFDSAELFFQYGGAVVWPLIVIAALAALWRRRIGENWRLIHALNFLAFWLATAHAILIGTDLDSTIVKAIAVGMSLAVAAIFVQQARRERRRRIAKHS